MHHKRERKETPTPTRRGGRRKGLGKKKRDLSDFLKKNLRLTSQQAQPELFIVHHHHLLLFVLFLLCV